MGVGVARSVLARGEVFAELDDCDAEEKVSGVEATVYRSGGTDIG